MGRSVLKSGCASPSFAQGFGGQLTLCAIKFFVDVKDFPLKEWPASRSFMRRLVEPTGFEPVTS